MGQETGIKGNVDIKFVDEIISKWNMDAAYLIPMMQDIQGRYNYLPRPALVHVQEKLKLPLTRVAEVATFYKTFSLKPKGKHIVHVCLGTACHLKGGPRIVDAFKRELSVEVDETTKDNLFTIQTVNCVGACALAPVVIIDGNVAGRQDASMVKRMISKIQKAEGVAEAPAAPAQPVKVEPAKPVAKKAAPKPAAKAKAVKAKPAKAKKAVKKAKAAKVAKKAAKPKAKTVSKKK